MSNTWTRIDGVNFSTHSVSDDSLRIYVASSDGNSLYSVTLTRPGIEKLIEFLDDAIAQPMMPELPEMSKEMN